MEPKHHNKREVGTKHVSLRIPNDAIAALETEAAHIGISLNAMASSILSKWARWDRHIKDLGLILIPPELIPILIKSKEEDVYDVVDDIFPFFQEAVIVIKGKYALKQAIETLEEFMQTTRLTSAHTIEGSAHNFIVRHKMGMYWSLFIKLLLDKLFKEFAPDSKVEYTIEDNIISARAYLGSDWDEHYY